MSESVRAEVDLSVHIPIERRMSSACAARWTKDEWRREVDWVEAVWPEILNF